MTRRFETVDKRLVMNVYATPACRRCGLEADCTTGPERRIRRWEHQAVINAMQERLSKSPEQMRLRRQTVEHLCGTLKAWMGATHFLTKALDRVSTEMSLHVLAYNLKRLLRIMGAELMMKWPGSEGLLHQHAASNSTKPIQAPTGLWRGSIYLYFSCFYTAWAGRCHLQMKGADAVDGFF